MNLGIPVLSGTHPFLLFLIGKKSQFKTPSPVEPGKFKVQAWT